MNSLEHKTFKKSLISFINHPYIIIDENHKMTDFQGKIDDLMDSNVYEVNQDILDLLHSDIKKIISPLLKISKSKSIITESEVFAFDYKKATLYLKLVIKPLQPITNKDEYIIIFEEQKLNNIIFSKNSIEAIKHKDRQFQDDLQKSPLNIRE